jgi:sugar lactone lactonase YvrE
MTVDAEGAIWVAIFGTGEVHRYTPDGELDRIVEVPHLAPTSCTFGGPELEDLFVTSGAEGPEHVFHCRPGTSGLPAARFAG